MGNLAPGRPTLNSALNVYNVNIVLNIVASLVTLVLIWYMRRNGSLKVNLYLKCVLLMTIHQLNYDAALTLTYPCGTTTGRINCHSFHTFWYVFGGLGAATWALIIVSVTTFMVEYGRHPTKCESNTAFFIIEGILIAWGIAQAIAYKNSFESPQVFKSLREAYAVGRLVIIGFTVALLLYLYYRVRQVTNVSDRQSSPLYHLVKRLVLYPIVQIVCRLGSSMYQFIYSAAIDSYPEGANTIQTASLFTYVLLTPLAGVGGLIVFLCMQHGAWTNLKRLMCCDFHVSQSEECVHPELTAPQRSLKRIPSSKGVGQDGGAEDTLDFATEIEDDSGLNYQYKTPSRESESVTTASTNRPSTISQSISLQSSVAGGGVQEKENFAKMDEGDLMRRYLRDNAQGRTLRSDVIPPPGAVSNSKMSSKLSSSDLGSSGIISLQPLSSDGAATAGMNPIHSENRI